MYRLIWFQHIHKAAGSLIVNQAIANGEILYPNHKNGNPHSPDGELIPLWDFNQNELKEFVDQCEEDGITFVSTEWGAPMYDILEADSRVSLVTCLRNPFSRLISNFNYDYYYGFTRSKSLSEYLTEELKINLDNFLVRVFSRKFKVHRHELDNSDVLKASTNLRRFNLVLVMERPGDLTKHLCEALGWAPHKVDTHGTFGNLRIFISLILKLRFSPAWNYSFKRKIGNTEIERSKFSKSSQLDMAFYNFLTNENVRGNLHPLYQNFD